ncbi:YraN family protein [bacterium]|nr:YraN family protein [bacterium]
MSVSQQKGRQGERVARQYLIDNGYDVIGVNFRSRWGEVDIIAHSVTKGLVFFEVKNFKLGAMVHPLEKVNFSKINRISRTIDYFLFKHPEWHAFDRRIEVIITDGEAVVQHITEIY